MSCSHGNANHHFIGSAEKANSRVQSTPLSWLSPQVQVHISFICIHICSQFKVWVWDIYIWNTKSKPGYEALWIVPTLYSIGANASDTSEPLHLSSGCCDVSFDIWSLVMKDKNNTFHLQILASNFMMYYLEYITSWAENKCESSF